MGPKVKEIEYLGRCRYNKLTIVPVGCRLVSECVVCSVRKDQQQIAKAELCDIVVSQFLDK